MRGRWIERENPLCKRIRGQAADQGADYSPAGADSLDAGLLNLPNREPRSVF